MGSGVKINNDRGEIIFPLNGREWTLRVTWRAIVDVQVALGYGLVPLACRLSGRNFGIVEVSQVIYHGLLASETKPEPSFEKVCEEVFKAGILAPEIVETITAFCNMALNGGRYDQGENQAAGGSQ